MKIFIIILIMVIAILVFMNIKNKATKTLLILGLIITGVMVGGSKYQKFATDELNTVPIIIDNYKYNDEDKSYTIDYTSNDGQKVSIDIGEDNIQYKMCNGLGEVELTERAYVQEIEFFENYRVQIKKEFKSEEPKYILNNMNFMSDEEIENILNQTNGKQSN